MRIVYMGTPEFAVPALEALIDLKKESTSNYDLVGVVTQPDRIKGRGKKLLPPPVKEMVLSYNEAYPDNQIPILQPDRIKENQDFFDRLNELNPDIIVVAAYGRILPKSILELPKYGCIDIHASLLPRWRGAAPMQHAILSGDEVTGVTIMQMAEGLDTGDMISKKETSLTYEVEGKEYKMYYPTLSDRLSKMGAELLIETLDDISKGGIVLEKQDEGLATYATMIKKEDGRVRFDIMIADEIERMIRAYEPWPGAFCYLGEEMVKLKAGEVLYSDDNKEPGTVLMADDSGIYIKAKDSIFKLTELQLPGKNWMDAGSYLRGHKLEIGSVFR